MVTPSWSSRFPEFHSAEIRQMIIDSTPTLAQSIGFFKL